MRRVLLAAMGAAAVLILVVFGMNISPYITVSELVKRRVAYNVQVVGVIVPNSTVVTDRGVYFKLTDGKATVKVFCRHLPANYREGVKVVVIGDYHNGTLWASQVLFKCASKYTVLAGPHSR